MTNLPEAKMSRLERCEYHGMRMGTVIKLVRKGGEGEGRSAVEKCRVAKPR